MSIRSSWEIFNKSIDFDSPLNENCSQLIDSNFSLTTQDLFSQHHKSDKQLSSLIGNKQKHFAEETPSSGTYSNSYRSISDNRTSQLLSTVNSRSEEILSEVEKLVSSFNRTHADQKKEILSKLEDIKCTQDDMKVQLKEVNSKICKMLSNNENAPKSQKEYLKKKLDSIEKVLKAQHKEYSSQKTAITNINNHFNKNSRPNNRINVDTTVKDIKLMIDKQNHMIEKCIKLGLTSKKESQNATGVSEKLVSVIEQHLSSNRSLEISLKQLIEKYNFVPSYKEDFHEDSGISKDDEAYDFIDELDNAAYRGEMSRNRKMEASDNRLNYYPLHNNSVSSVTYASSLDEEDLSVETVGILERRRYRNCKLPQGNQFRSVTNIYHNPRSDRISEQLPLRQNRILQINNSETSHSITGQRIAVQPGAVNRSRKLQGRPKGVGIMSSRKYGRHL